jgi:hypothetical protein
MSVSTGDVAAILENPPTLPNGSVEDLTVFITTATQIITSANCSLYYDDDLIDELTKYLAAHIIDSRRSDTVEERIGESSYRAESSSAKSGVSGFPGFGETAYGRTALLLDYQGCLRKNNLRRTRFKAFGPEAD